MLLLKYISSMFQIIHTILYTKYFIVAFAFLKPIYIHINFYAKLLIMKG